MKSIDTEGQCNGLFLPITTAPQYSRLTFSNVDQVGLEGYFGFLHKDVHSSGRLRHKINVQLEHD